MEPTSILKPYKYHLLATAYVLLTAGAILRIYNRQPYNRNMKLDQMETVFTAATLGAVRVGSGRGGGINRSRSGSGSGAG